MSQSAAFDYSLTGPSARRAIEQGLAEADWYRSPVPRDRLRELLQRRDGPAIRDTLLWFASLALTGWASVALWGSWWVVPVYLLYAVLYATASDSRWHECGHGTPFRSDWMNNAVYEIASFMVMRESVIWRWSHTRHHSDTIVVGRDPEIQVHRPPVLRDHLLSLLNIGGYRSYYPGLWQHALGRMTEAEKTFVPETEFGKVYRNARIALALNAVAVLLAIALQSWAPIFLIVLPHLFGNWLMIVHNSTQHAGLQENVLDHRLNCRTVYMNPFSRFVYWNMNYHVEHHMFPLVPYHALPRLHELIKDDCPPPYTNILSAWREIIPAVLRQRTEPGYSVKRPLPASREVARESSAAPDVAADAEGWVPAGPAAALAPAAALRFDHGKRTFALVRDEAGCLHATDGICSHGNTHLADGLVKDGIIECPKHNGRFKLSDGSPARAPVCRGIATYPLQERDGQLWLNPSRASAVQGGDAARTWRLRVVSNRNVATFIKELVLEPLDEGFSFTPGDYLQLDIPAYDDIRFDQFDIPAPYADNWRAQRLFELTASNPSEGRRNNYSLAGNAAIEPGRLRFNVRIALPADGFPPGVGSSYVFSLKPGDRVTAIGSMGDFHIKPTQREMVYIGGGAGMAPLRAHLSHLFETERTARRVSYWYGARSLSEVFYAEDFRAFAREHPNFSFHLALSAPVPADDWVGPTGFIHDIVLEHHLKAHPNPRALEFYLCGPPQMVQACTAMLERLGVPAHQIAFDEF